jgi:hypothetical protein
MSWPFMELGELAMAAHAFVGIGTRVPGGLTKAARREGWRRGVDVILPRQELWKT